MKVKNKAFPSASGQSVHHTFTVKTKTKTCHTFLLYDEAVFLFFFHSCSDAASLHPRRCDGLRPVGSAGSHRLLDSDNRPAVANGGVQAGVLGGENRLGALVLRTDCERQDGHLRHHGAPPVRSGAGVRSVDAAVFYVGEVTRSGEAPECSGEPTEGSGEEERGVKVEEVNDE